jgi:thioredoxin reductase
MLPRLSADKISEERRLTSPKVEVKCGYRIEAIHGDGKVKSLCNDQLSPEGES